MKNHRRPHALWLAIPAAVGTYLLYSLLNYGLSAPGSESGFGLLGLNRVPAFNDVKWLLSFAACKGDIRSLITTNASCFGYKNPGYPALSMELARFLGWGPDDARWIGILSGTGLMAAMAHACWLCTANVRSWSIIVGLLGLSFPFQVVLERGNIDSVLFLLIALFGLAAWKPGPWSILLANVIAAFSISLKVYPAIASIAWMIYSIRTKMTSKRKRILAQSLLATTAASLLFTAFSIYSRLAPASGGLRSHGLSAIGYANVFLLNEFGFTLGRLAIYALFLIKALSIFIGCSGGFLWGRQLAWPIFFRRPSKPLLSQYINTLIMITSAVGIGCYIFSIGYDYRLIFLFPILTLIFSNLIDNPTLHSSNRRFLALLAAAASYIFYLPFATSLSLRTSTALEMVDEMILAPFLLSALAAIWIHLWIHPWQEPSSTS